MTTREMSAAVAALTSRVAALETCNAKHCKACGAARTDAELRRLAAQRELAAAAERAAKAKAEQERLAGCRQRLADLMAAEPERVVVALDPQFQHENGFVGLRGLTCAKHHRPSHGSGYMSTLCFGSGVGSTPPPSRCFAFADFRAMVSHDPGLRAALECGQLVCRVANADEQATW